jgi:hypothetical protein
MSRSAAHIALIAACAFGAAACGSNKDSAPLSPTGSPSTDDTHESAETALETEETEDTGPSSTLVLGEPIVCADPTEREALGPLYERAVADDWATAQVGGVNVPTTIKPAPGYGVTVADLTGDGLLDVFLPVNGAANQLYVQTPDGGLVEEGVARGVGGPEDVAAMSAVAVDVEGDGDLDLTVFAIDEPVELWINDGTGVFTASDAVGGTSLHTIAGAYNDVDLDGDLDLALANHQQDGVGGPTTLFRQAEPLVFEDATSLTEQVVGGFSFGVVFVDLNLDLYPDLYESNDHGGSVVGNRLLQNIDGYTRFVDASNATYTGVAIDSMGVALGDLNEDGWPDLIATNTGRMVLLESFGDGTWLQTQVGRELSHTFLDGAEHYVGWGIALEDLDNDTDLDVPMAVGPVSPNFEEDNPEEQPDAVFLQGDDGVFDEVASEWGVDFLSNDRGLAVVDFDRNGWLDLVIRNVNGPARIMLARCGEAHWLEVALQQSGPNRDAIGARVQVELDDGRTLTRWLTAGGTSFATSLPAEVHFGLGAMESVPTLRVLWPDGGVDELHDLPVDRQVRVIRSEAR